ncbi:MAG: hypothetical protein GX654_03915 [Desulfatiglans sp.]|jgi:hypothetical protein|nr:hypothetical protein [Desulfatiglans sp.]
MNSIIQQTSLRIRSGVEDLEVLAHRINEGWAKAEHNADTYYLDSVALNLHGFYTGLERLFEIIVTNIDGTIPEGENWHQQLLKQVSKELPKIRPAIISKSSFLDLNELRGFRHVVRNVYTFNFNPSKIKTIVEKIPDLFSSLKAELTAFADFLDDA